MKKEWVSSCLGATRGGEDEEEEEEAEFREQVFLLELERKERKSGDYFVCERARENYGLFCEGKAKVRESDGSRTPKL